MNTPLAIINLSSTADVPAAIAYYANKKKVGKFIDGLHTGTAVGSPKELASLLLANHHNPRGKRVARTGVISVKTPRHASKQELEDIDERLIQTFEDFQKLLKVPLLGWIHTNTATRHLHVIWPNSDGRHCLDLRPRWLRQLQGFAWTVALASGRGKGRRKALPVYPKANKLAVRDLAKLLIDEQGNLRQKQWDALVKSGKISNFRQRKNGELISFEYGGKRCRVATLKGFITECQNTRPINEDPNYETTPCTPERDRASQPIVEPDRGTPTHRNNAAVSPAAGPDQCRALPVALPAEPAVASTPALLAQSLGQAATQCPASNTDGAPDAEPTRSSPLPPRGLAVSRRRFKRRSQPRPAPVANPANPSPVGPRFRTAGPGIGL
jgi:hypothetical protein